jgi:hypothetical protein
MTSTHQPRRADNHRDQGADRGFQHGRFREKQSRNPEVLLPVEPRDVVARDGSSLTDPPDLVPKSWT